MDTQARFRLALHANTWRDPHTCMKQLKELLQAEPQHAGALHLLAIQYSELRLYERAIDALKQVLAIDARREVARLHLGLLLLDQLRDVEALEQFRELQASSDDAIRLCAEAMAAAASSNLSHPLMP
jgi:tetratricopeptide (TPR) repeat protein